MRSPSAARAVLCLGEAIVDLIGQPPAAMPSITHFEPRLGGAPCNVAIGLRRLGLPATYLGAVARDDLGDWLLRQLQAEGVDIGPVVRVEQAQTRLALISGPAEARAFAFYGHPAADTQLQPADVPTDAVTGAAAVYTGALPLRDPPAAGAVHLAIDLAARHGVPVCFDPNPRPGSWPSREELHAAVMPILAVATLVKLSAADLEVLGLTAGDIPRVAPRASVCALTDGAGGCRYWLAGAWGWRPAFAVESVDGTGAGDAFTAALIARGVESGFRYTPADIAFASAAGALATTRLGAAAALPRRAEILRLVAARRRSG